jgi:hypothetical protein
MERFVRKEEHFEGKGDRHSLKIRMTSYSWNDHRQGMRCTLCSETRKSGMELLGRRQWTKRAEFYHFVVTFVIQVHHHILFRFLFPSQSQSALTFRRYLKTIAAAI